MSIEALVTRLEQSGVGMRSPQLVAAQFALVVANKAGNGFFHV
jgi:hypothetical protein